ncbi:unnamed protein product [Oikopleura dioica]|uniref:Uncharacterized protein n=1 Tax=Oikopleura dioica TaxID=34765 RepID=E4XL44_OIKDI|nr:unnamed protein product [Oikopleura dioica]
MQHPQQMLMSNFQQRPVSISPVNQTSQIANFANQQVIQNAKPPQYQEVQEQSSSQAPPQRYFNVGRSPKIDEYRLQQIKNDLKSPITAPTNITVKTEPPSSFQSPPTMSNIYIKNEPKHQSQQNAAFGNQQFRVAPGAGPLPGLSVQHQRPSVLQHQHVQPMRVQQHVFRAYNPQNGTFTIQPQMTLAPRPTQRPAKFLLNQTRQHRRKKLDLQPPRRQSGIEVVGRSPVR